MNYKKIKMTLRGKEDFLYREFLVRENVNLIELACIMSTLIKATNEHHFYFVSSTNKYLPEELIMGALDELYMADYKMADLGNDFVFIYDTNENWIFDCHVSNKIVKKDGNDYVKIIDGRGMGIFEDAMATYDAYTLGYLDPNKTIDDIEKETSYPVPSNLDILYYGQSDDYDVEIENEDIAKEVAFDIFDYIDDEHNLGYEKDVENINLQDYIPYDELDDFFGVPDDLREVFDEDFENIFNIFESTLLAAVDEQIKNVDYVEGTYQRLLKKYGEHSAKMMIMDKLVLLLREALRGTSKEYHDMLDDID